MRPGEVARRPIGPPSAKLGFIIRLLLIAVLGGYNGFIMRWKSLFLSHLRGQKLADRRPRHHELAPVGGGLNLTPTFGLHCLPFVFCSLVKGLDYIYVSRGKDLPIGGGEEERGPC